MNVPDPVPAIDGLLAATAIVHDLTLVTRNRRDVERCGARLLDPFPADERFLRQWGSAGQRLPRGLQVPALSG